MIHVGFTGTQQGMTDEQARRVFEILRYKDFYAHHGVCVGADADFDLIARNITGCRGLVLHPCTIAAKQAPIEPRYPYDVVRPVKSPLVRNRDIVRESDALVATPKETAVQFRSGTWTTIRYAREARRPITIIYPNGAWSEEGPPWPA